MTLISRMVAEFVRLQWLALVTASTIRILTNLATSGFFAGFCEAGLSLDVPCKRRTLKALSRFCGFIQVTSRRLASRCRSRRSATDRSHP